MGERRIDEDELNRIARDYEPRIFEDSGDDERSEEQFLSLDYKTFKTEERGAKKKLNIYEKLCSISEKILKVEPSKSSAEQLRKEIDFTGLQCTPAGITSAAFLLPIFLVLVSVAAAAIGAVPIFIGVTMLVFSILSGVYIHGYPAKKARDFRVKASEEIVLSVVYMVISMRISPNLENAVKFVATNLTGPLALDFRKLLWDIYMRKEDSIDRALDKYISSRWKNENEEFSSALTLIRNSVDQPEKKRLVMLDEAVDVILKGTRERMGHYAQNLRMPLLIIHAMGILLPIMGLVMFPVLVLFLSNIVQPYMLFLGYDVFLFLGLYWYTSNILATKPPTLSKPDVSEHPDTPKEGYFRAHLSGKKIEIRTYILPALLFAALFFIGYSGMTNSAATSFARVMYSTVIIASISLPMSLYAFLESFQRTSVRRKVISVENEFAEAIFHLGNQLSSGTPIENAIDKNQEKIRDLGISDFFGRIVQNIKRLGMTFEQAIFDKNYGAVWYYPSSLIISVMKVVVEAVRKGVYNASQSMLSISRYLKDVHAIEEELRDILGESTTSMKFLGAILAPMVAGVTVTMALIMLDIIKVLGEKLADLTAQGVGSSLPLFLTVGLDKGGVTAEVFQLVVGIYMIEVAGLLSYFVSKIETGEDRINLYHTLSINMFISLVVYVLAITVVYSTLGSQIKDSIIGGL
ncbi:MAG: hypothetical protein HYS53_02570 [Candidatus Aenigmarchaeota archaeon]|nr:hypothetical protein [Candidatus Aenigmarchaeota archaeon]